MMTEIELDQRLMMSTIVKAADGQVSCDLSGEAAILNLETGVYYGLNAVGAFIWNLIQKPVSVEQIKEAILAEYEVDPARCERDLLRLLNELADRGLINVKPGTNS
jgi:hypothetical protein